LLRYVNGDSGLFLANKVGKHDKLPLKQFNLIIGRNCEYLINKKNEKIMGPIIGHLAAEKKLNIGEFQLVQKSRDCINLNIVKDESSAKEDVEKFKKIIRETLGAKQIIVRYFDSYPLEKNGKRISYKCLISESPR
jgi:hypothetical protein